MRIEEQGSCSGRSQHPGCGRTPRHGCLRSPDRATRHRQLPKRFPRFPKLPSAKRKGSKRNICFKTTYDLSQPKLPTKNPKREALPTAHRLPPSLLLYSSPCPLVPLSSCPCPHRPTT